MGSLRVLANCKINLGLDILFRRPDAYHELDMVMQEIRLFDVLELETQPAKAGEGQLVLRCEHKGVPCDETNLISRCAKGFYKAISKAADTENLQVCLEKKIPMQAGLGGGSADAAAVLRGLNALHGAGLTLEQLCEIGLGYGADIPFCLHGGTARVQGIGERISPLPPLPKCWIVIAKPRIAICTAQAFAAWDLHLRAPHANISSLVAALESGNLAEIGGCMENVFESICDERSSREVQRLRGEMLRYGALGARMTGSGSAVFGIFGALFEAELCRACLMQDKGLEAVFLAEPV